ncbi:MAG TPA: hypothetical protein VN622_11305 [Clostridia bacterium]|nr:hypothetical protein [Clostridia bacterium]
MAYSIHRISKTARTVIGVLLSVIAALVASFAFADKPVRAFLPFVFVAVLVLLAARYGVAVSVIGSALTAIIFAHFLYSPLGSLHVDSAAARSNIAWMIMLAVSVSYLLFPPSEVSNKKH